MKRFIKNNKGFTLLELIVVISIIAVLAAVLAPQFIQYVDKARQANDLQIANSYMKAASVAVLDIGIPEKDLLSDWYTFKWGYTTNDKNGLNMHIGSVPVINGAPTIASTQNKRDAKLQGDIARILGWATPAGELDPNKIERPQSSSVQYIKGKAQMNSFIFYINIRTGEILVDKNLSANWVNDVGVNAPLTP